MSGTGVAPTYTIRTVRDFLRVPDGRRAVCMQEFRVWLAMMDDMSALLGTIKGLKAKPSEEFIWIDDDLHTATLTITAGDTVIPVATGTMKGFDALDELTALRAENAALVADNARLMGMLEGEP